ncbi:Ldh family oxidoreductase [Myxococcota bacterium]|nr:Ldh family oxidoreductase [Myxococcota bacterium]
MSADCSDSQRVTPDRLEEYCAAILEHQGVPAPDAATVAACMVDADLRGIDSHGAHLLDLYLTRLEAGQLQAITRTRIVRDEGPFLHLDGGLGLGQVTGRIALEQAIERAREHGFAAVSVRETSHLGALGYYTRRAAEQGLFSMLFQNGPPFVPAFGGMTGLFSTNPISYAVPAGNEPPIVYDVATTAVAGNKLLLARRKGDTTIPSGWANDAQGHPTTDPQAASMNHLQWFGGHKGFGIGLLVEVLSGVLTGSCYALTHDSDSPVTGFERVAKGYLLLTMDVERFMPAAQFRSRVDDLIGQVRRSETAPGFERVMVPGEPEHLRMLERRRDGIPLPSALIEDLDRCGAAAGLGPLLPPTPES